MKRGLATLVVLGVLVALGWSALSRMTIDANPASIARSMTYNQKVEYCDAASGGTDGGFQICMDGMFLAEEGIQNPVIPDLAQPAEWATYLPGYTIQMRNSFVQSYASTGSVAFGACLFDMLASSLPLEQFREVSSSLNSGAEVSSIAPLATAISNCENGTFFGLSDSRQEASSLGQDSKDAAPGPSEPPADVPGDIIGAYMTALSSWSAAGFDKMMELSAPNSPAWSYAFHLRNGRTSELQSGWQDGHQLKLIEDQDSFRLCLTSSCSTKYSDFEVSDKIVTFKINDRDLSESVTSHADSSATVCSEFGFCMALRSIFWTGQTVFATVEVSVNEEAVEAISRIPILALPNGDKLKMTSGTTPKSTESVSAIYSMGFKGASSPWGGLLIFDVETQLGSDRIRLRL